MVAKRKRQYSFDPKCLDLATYFYPAASADRLNDLAQRLQDQVEAEDLDTRYSVCADCDAKGFITCSHGNRPAQQTPASGEK